MIVPYSNPIDQSQIYNRIQTETQNRERIMTTSQAMGFDKDSVTDRARQKYEASIEFIRKQSANEERRHAERIQQAASAKAEARENSKRVRRLVFAVAEAQNAEEKRAISTNLKAAENSGATSATVLRIGERFFAKTSKDGRLQTAWSLAGAMMFGPWQTDDIEAAERMIHRKGKSCERVAVAAVLHDGGDR